MSERNGFEPGVPCWVDTWPPDAEAAAAFYTALFGWEADTSASPDHIMLRLRGRDVAAVGSRPGEDAGAASAWGTHIWVDSADDTATRVTDAGGSVVTAPFDSLDGGRMAIVADPAGAAFGVWQPGAHRGAQTVNEPGAWAMSALSTSDPDGANAFYGRVFGWTAETFAAGEVAATLWRLPGFVGGEPEQPVPRDVVAVMMPLPDGSPARWNVDFWVDDTDAAADTAARLGGAVIAPPMDSPVGRTAVLADPHGAVFSVSRVSVPGGAA